MSDHIRELWEATPGGFRQPNPEPEGARDRMQQIEKLLEEEVSARTAYEEDGVSGSAHYLGLIMELAPPDLHKRLAEPEGARDHEAMEILRSASLKKGWKWQWDGMDLQQVTLGPNAPNTHKDPADAVIRNRHPKP